MYLKLQKKLVLSSALLCEYTLPSNFFSDWLQLKKTSVHCVVTKTLSVFNAKSLL